MFLNVRFYKNLFTEIIVIGGQRQDATGILSVKMVYIFGHYVLSFIFKEV